MNDTQRLHWLHSPESNNIDGYEWGIYRVKWVNGKAAEVWQTNADFSDLDAAIAASTQQVSEMNVEPTDEQIADAIECAFSATGEWPDGDAAIVRAYLKYAQQPQAEAPLTDEPALWQYRWLNPRGADVQPPEMTEWKELKPSMFGQTMEQRVAEIRAFRFQGEPCYEARAVYAHPNYASPAEARSQQLNGVLFAMSMLVAMVEKNRARIKEEDSDTYYLDRNLAICKKLLASNPVLPNGAQDEPTPHEQKMARCLGFFASAIKSGEPWTEQCQREYDEALTRTPQEPKT